MSIKSCKYDIDKSHLSRYKDLQKYKSDKKTSLNDHLHKTNSSIARMQDKFSVVIDNINNIKSEFGFIFNISAESERSSFGKISSMSENSYPMNN